MSKEERDIEQYPTRDAFVAKLRRLADALESERPFRIQIAGERIRVPTQAQFSVEHEREEGEQELEFQLKWKFEESDDEDENEEEV